MDCSGVAFAEISPECHPERRGISPQSGEMERSRTFAGRGCDISQLVAKWRTAASKSASATSAQRDLQGAFQRLLSLCNIFKVIPNQLHSNVTWCRQACHKPFGDPFLVKSLRDFPRQVLDRLAATVPLSLQNFDSVSFHRFAVKFSSAQDDTWGRTDRSKARKSPAN